MVWHRVGVVRAGGTVRKVMEEGKREYHQLLSGKIGAGGVGASW